MTLSDLELTAIYAAMTHCIKVCDIYWEQDDDLKEAVLTATHKVTAEMEKRKLLGDQDGFCPSDQR